MSRAAALLLAVAFLLGAPLRAAATEVRAAVHVHTTWGGGSRTPAEVARLARERGLQAVFLSDHELMRPTLGLPPFENLLAVWTDLPSVLHRGPEAYLAEVKAASEATGVLLVPGAETAPHARWTGAPWSGLRLEGWFRHVLLLGLYEPEVWRNLPVPRNPGQIRVETIPGWPLAAPFLAIGVSAALALAGRSRRARAAAWAVAGVNALAAGHLILGAMTPWPIQGPASRTAGWAPYQAVIDYARSAGALAVWAHPDTPGRNHTATYGGVRVSIPSEPYPEALRHTRGYTGFEGLIGAPAVSARPGGAWDEALREALREARPLPWAFAAQDFDDDTESSWLGELQVVIRARDATAKACLEALSEGRFYAVRRARDNDLRLGAFRLVSGRGTAQSGETLVSAEPARLEVELSSDAPTPVRVRIVRDGEVVAELREETPVTVQRTLEPPPARGPGSYVRIEVEGPGPNRILSNPVVWRVPNGKAGAS